jgi:hypothetical protein
VLVVVLVAAVATVVITRSLVGQIAGRRADGARLQVGPVHIERRQPGPRPPPMPGQPHEQLQRAMNMSEMGVTVDDRQVTVTGTAAVYDAARDGVYVWSLRIHGGPKFKQLIREHHYADQAAPPPDGELRFNPPFRDTFEMEPGTYQLQLILSVVPPSFRFDKLKPGEDVKKLSKRVLSMVSRSARITVK